MSLGAAPQHQAGRSTRRHIHIFYQRKRILLGRFELNSAITVAAIMFRQTGQEFNRGVDTEDARREAEDDISQVCKHRIEVSGAFGACMLSKTTAVSQRKRLSDCRY